MKLRSGRLAGILAIAAMSVGAAVWGWSAHPPGPVAVRLVHTEATSGAENKTISVEFTKSASSQTWFDSSPGGCKMQIRLNGRWEAPVEFGRTDQPWFFRTNRQTTVFMVPSHTQACRFLLAYRVGRSPYCTAYFFLARHGLMKQHPKLCQRVLKCFSGQPARLRHTAPELALPEERLGVSATPSVPQAVPRRDGGPAGRA